MKKHHSFPILSTPAVLWDGVSQLAGSLELWETEIVFRPSGFTESHLDLRIPLAAIEKVDPYLVFGLAKNGLRIQAREGKNDLFVLDDVQGFRDALLKELS